MPFPITATEIAKTEAKLGVRFPDAFKLAMSEDNGGEIEAAEESWQLFPFLDTSDRKRLSRTCNDITMETKAAREWRGFPPSGFAIAQSACGDLLILLPSEGDPLHLDDTIHLWNHETGELSEVACSLVDLRQ